MTGTGRPRDQRRVAVAEHVEVEMTARLFGQDVAPILERVAGREPVFELADAMTDQAFNPSAL